MNRGNELKLFEKIKQGDEKAFGTIFHHFYPLLCTIASGITGNDYIAEEIVQDLFVKLWEKKKSILIDTSLKNYLIRAVKNQCLNYLEHKKVQQRLIDDFISGNKSEEIDDFTFIDDELLKKIEESISSLPDKRRKIFRLSREEGKKYNEIAAEMKISPKTVEAQIGLALKTLRSNLKDLI